MIPDTLVEKDGERIYVEVELGYGNQAKWRNMAEALGYVAFCGRSREQVKAVKNRSKLVEKNNSSTSISGLIQARKFVLE